MLTSLMMIAGGCAGQLANKEVRFSPEDERVAVVVVAQAQEGKAEVMEKEFIDLVSFARSQEGCLTFNLHRTPEEGKYMLYEVWSNSETIESFRNSDYVNGLFSRASGFMAANPEMSFWTCSK